MKKTKQNKREDRGTIANFPRLNSCLLNDTRTQAEGKNKKK